MQTSQSDVMAAVFNNQSLFKASSRPNPFKLCRGDFMTLRYEDYGLILNEAKGKKRILEFGPGCSTWAFIEAECKEIVTCEYLTEWLEKAREQFKDYPQVKVVRYWDEPVARAEIEGEFDLALVDSPKGYKYTPGITPPGGRVPHPGMEDCSRLNTCLLALKHAPVVLLHDASRPFERATLGRLSAMGHKVSFISGSPYGLARIIRNENTSGASLQGA